MTTAQKDVFYNDAFAKTSQQRREKIIQHAIVEFAKNGYFEGNINIIAENSKVSIGAMYSYFASKEDLFLTVVSELLAEVSRTLAKINMEQAFPDLLFDVFDTVRKSCIENREYSQIFQHITAHSMKPMAERLSSDFELSVINMLHFIIERAKQKGELSPSINTKVLAFSIDNLMLIYQLSFSSDYYQERMRLFLGDPKEDEQEELLNQKDVIKNMVAIVCQQHAM